ncbi:Dormancy/auxin associated protein, expressed [Zostera marina]|uniref:Dormancy/auxin associated protein, expressed n=1 Tax=Zostera marina TaxID=29655 RepID=A0A0K9PYR0_ZOSMR|nr:Dormancy/auxin associated protein, expressed [Zostera marina]
MGLLDKLWDDTVAGPRPDTGLGRLRKFKSLSINTGITGTEASDGMKKTIGNESSRASKDEAPRVSRSIMIRRPAGSPSTNGTPPESPAGSVTPCSSPFLGSPGSKEWNRFRRKSMSDVYERRATRTSRPSSSSAVTGGVDVHLGESGNGSGSSSFHHSSPFEV